MIAWFSGKCLSAVFSFCVWTSFLYLFTLSLGREKCLNWAKGRFYCEIALSCFCKVTPRNALFKKFELCRRISILKEESSLKKEKKEKGLWSDKRIRRNDYWSFQFPVNCKAYVMGLEERWLLWHTSCCLHRQVCKREGDESFQPGKSVLFCEWNCNNSITLYWK